MRSTVSASGEASPAQVRVHGEPQGGHVVLEGGSLGRRVGRGAGERLDGLSGRDVGLERQVAGEALPPFRVGRLHDLSAPLAELPARLQGAFDDDAGEFPPLLRRRLDTVLLEDDDGPLLGVRHEFRVYGHSFLSPGAAAAPSMWGCATM
jgi:hypothetical protein